MRERLTDLSDAEVAASLSARWGMQLTTLSYLPVGFGGFHWEAKGASGLTLFVTASQIAGPDALADLEAAMETAASLAEAGCGFVVAPLRTMTGRVVLPLRSGYALTLFPFADGEPGSWGDPMAQADRATLMDLLAILHTQRPPAGIPRRPADLSGRRVIEDSIGERGGPWHGGPYAEAARALVCDFAGPLLAALATFDDLEARLAWSGASPVITHGEPHPGNLIRRGAGYLLIDWDTVGLAQPERDLWWPLAGRGAEPRDSADLIARYRDQTGREVSQAGLALYKLRWDLDDISLFLADFRGPHQQNADTRIAWDALVAAVRRVAAAPHP